MVDMTDQDATDYDFIIVGSGFGGSVSALRLVEKGYRVLLLEKGSRRDRNDFPRTNWQLKRWLWAPRLGWRGSFKMTFLRHLTALSGVGVGGGSLVYANTLPLPKPDFFSAPSWGHLARWKEELAPHYQTARRMLGVTENRIVSYADEVIREIGEDLGRPEHFELTQVGVFFGEPDKTVPDPYFDGEGPDRVGCIGCGGCMLGCRVGAKNTLDLNYLYLAEKRGLHLEADTEVTWVRPRPKGGYWVDANQGRSRFRWRNARRRYHARQVVFAGGVLGTVPLLLALKASPDGLPRLSDRLGEFVRTNSEVLMGVVSRRSDRDMSKGIAIGSILHTDSVSHVEPVRYPEGAGFFRLLGVPHVSGPTVWRRLASTMMAWARHPVAHARAMLVRDWARSTMIMLYMRTVDGHLRLRLGRGGRISATRRLVTSLSDGPAPTASIPEADDLGARIAEKIEGTPQSLFSETLLGTPTTAHILGGCTMGSSAADGVIDHRHRLFGYDGLYVIDGSAISANPGVNPSLTITALAERATSLIPPKS